MSATEPVALDGASGEGGGQIVRTALSLSLVTGRPFAIDRIRARRSPPGLRPQHLTAVKAAQTVGGAEVEGAEVGSSSLRFRPGAARPGDYLFDVGTAGSVSLLFQALCFPLALAGAPSSLKLRGGTHVARSPNVHYLSLAWAPAMRQLGFRFEVELERAGFYPEGGGELTARVLPAEPARNFDCLSRGTLQEVQVLSLVAGVPYGVAERQSARALQRLRERGIYAQAENLPLVAPRSRGSALLINARFERSRACFAQLGEKGVSAERVADAVAEDFARFMSSGGAVEPHLADQLLLPLALGASGSQGGTPSRGRYTTSAITQHLLTQAEVIQRFLSVRIAVRGELDEEGEVIVAPQAQVEA